MSPKHPINARYFAARVSEWDSRWRDEAIQCQAAYQRAQIVGVVGLVGVVLDIWLAGALQLGTWLLALGLFNAGCMGVYLARRQVVGALADLARTCRCLAGWHLGSMARERRSASASARGIAAVVARATARVRQSRLAAHRLAARLRAALGTMVPTSHPRIAASLAAGSLRTSAA